MHMYNLKPEWRDVDNGGVVNRGQSWRSNETPLALAVRYGHAEVVRAMLDPCWKGLKNEVSTACTGLTLVHFSAQPETFSS